MNGTSLKSDVKHWLKQGNSVTILIIINIVVFLLFGLVALMSLLTNNSLEHVYAFMFNNMTLHSLPSVLIEKPWGLITNMFTHTDPFHILGNMLIFFFFGNLFRSDLGNRRVVPLYLISGFFCACMMVLANNLLPMQRGIDWQGLGASGAVMCFTVAAATLMPNLEVQLFFVANVRIKWIAAALVIIDMISLPRGNFGGHIAHLAGAAFGYIYIRNLQQGRDFTAPLANLFEWVGDRFARREPSAPKKFKPKKSPLRVVRNNEPSHASRLDQLLDKINEKGYNSLTSEEKSWLRKYSDEK